MNAPFIIVILALLWAAMTGSFSGINLLFGGLIGGLAALLLRRFLPHSGSLRRTGRILSLLGLFLYELMASAVRVAVIVLRPDMSKVIQPAIVAVPLAVKSDIEITLLASLVTLTPGTLSIDVSQDRTTLYVHTLVLGDRNAVIADIKNSFEKKVLEVFE